MRRKEAFLALLPLKGENEANSASQDPMKRGENEPLRRVLLSSQEKLMNDRIANGETLGKSPMVGRLAGSPGHS